MKRRKSPIPPRWFLMERPNPGVNNGPDQHSAMSGGGGGGGGGGDAYDDVTTGSSELIVGPMFSGKSSELMNRMKTAIIGGKRICVIMPDMDTRYTKKSMISSHDGHIMSAIRVNSLTDAPDKMPEDVDVIGIDEGQFFEGLASFVERQNALGRNVIVAALKADANRNGWPHVLELFPKVDTVTTRHGVCVICQQQASCSRSINGTLGLGADEKYVATCFGCWQKPLPPGVLTKRALRVKIVKEMTTNGDK